jgi:hypothetical protein
MRVAVVAARMEAMVVHMIMIMMMGTVTGRRHRHCVVERRLTHTVKGYEEGASLHP